MWTQRAAVLEKEAKERNSLTVTLTGDEFRARWVELDRAKERNSGTLTRFPAEEFQARWAGLARKDQNPVNRVKMVTNAIAKNRARLEAELREKGMRTELDDSNKGFAMLQKMGYKKGENLGKSGGGGEDGDSPVVVQTPITVTVKNDRSGLGREALLKERSELEKRVKETLHNGTRRTAMRADKQLTDKDDADSSSSHLRIALTLHFAADDEAVARAERLAAVLADEAVRVELALPEDRNRPNAASARRTVICHDSNRLSQLTQNSPVVTRLHSMFPPPGAPQYRLTSVTGPPHKPLFTMVCTVGDRSFQGEGGSKKAAKISCSQKALFALTGPKSSEAGTDKGYGFWGNQKAASFYSSSSPVTPRPLSPASLWNAPAKLVDKRDQKGVKIEVEGDSKKEVIKILWSAHVQLVEDEEASKKTGADLFHMFDIGQKFTADAAKTGDNDDFVISTLHVELEEIDPSLLRAFGGGGGARANSKKQADPCSHGINECPWCQK